MSTVRDALLAARAALAGSLRLESADQTASTIEIVLLTPERELALIDAALAELAGIEGTAALGVEGPR